MNRIDVMLNGLRKDGKRITPQRVAICRLLANTDRHPTAQEIYDELRFDYPSLSLATIYNTLETLVSSGTITSLGSAGDNAVHYDADTSPHVNLACIHCHRVFDLPSKHIDNLEKEVMDQSRFRLLGARVLYYGICPECQAAESLPEQREMS